MPTDLLVAVLIILGATAVASIPILAVLWRGRPYQPQKGEAP